MVGPLPGIEANRVALTVVEPQDVSGLVHILLVSLQKILLSPLNMLCSVVGGVHGMEVHGRIAGPVLNITGINNVSSVGNILLSRMPPITQGRGHVSVFHLPVCLPVVTVSLFLQEGQSLDASNI